MAHNPATCSDPENCDECLGLAITLPAMLVEVPVFDGLGNMQVLLVSSGALREALARLKANAWRHLGIKDPGIDASVLRRSR